SFDKKLLIKVYTFAKKYLGAKMMKLKQEKISHISIMRLLPHLTQKQKQALELAIQNGYYEYPKKITLEKLAQLMKISYATYQQHLKTAEGKMIPSIYKSL
ncbi:helix-turn-helix domain-containing protein, partial [Candidatus Woesearchaeota archaeon]|nr:helix-turn-helix domain-containing protein [Candidatus Woesearchaeota archaeon]